MNPFESLSKAYDDLYDNYENRIAEPAFFIKTDVFSAKGSGVLACGDNMSFARHLLDSGLKGKVNFVYIDPPFFTGSSQLAKLRIKDGSSDKVISAGAYKDSKAKGIEKYLFDLGLRICAAKELMAEDAVIAVHLDWHAVHYVKLLMDGIFGSERLVNEIIWSYKSGGFGGKGFAKKHDTILVYSKNKNYFFKQQKEKSYNRGLKPYRFKGVKEYQDETGWYTLVNRRDVVSVDMVARSAPERTGYATQKPLKLMDILLESFAKPEGICLDLYSGSATLAEAAAGKDMTFYCCDSNPSALSCAAKRLAKNGFGFEIFCENVIEESSAELRLVPCSEQLSMESAKGKILYELDCTGFDFNTLKLGAKELQKLKKAVSSNPSAIADFAAGGFTEDGVFIAEELYLPGKTGAFRTEISDTVRCVKLWDKFGNTAVMEMPEKYFK